MVDDEGGIGHGGEESQSIPIENPLRDADPARFQMFMQEVERQPGSPPVTFVLIERDSTVTPGRKDHVLVAGLGRVSDKEFPQSIEIIIGEGEEGFDLLSKTATDVSQLQQQAQAASTSPDLAGGDDIAAGLLEEARDRELGRPKEASVVLFGDTPASANARNAVGKMAQAMYEVERSFSANNPPPVKTATPGISRGRIVFAQTDFRVGSLEGERLNVSNFDQAVRSRVRQLKTQNPPSAGPASPAPVGPIK
jgi:hypothetical protein